LKYYTFITADKDAFRGPWKDISLALFRPMRSAEESAYRWFPVSSKPQGEFVAKPYRTSEVRWFISGAMPLAVIDWFVQALHGDWAESVLTREDLYLLVPGRDDVGLKFRKDKIQLKLRCDRRPFLVLEGRVAGVETDWERHSWIYDEKENGLVQAFSGQAGEGHRVVVSKKRRKKTYDLAPHGGSNPLAPGEKVRGPVSIEVTEIAFAGFSGWSLGLEVVGSETAARGRLLPVAAELLRDFPALPLKRCDSLDYPALIWRRAL
jgi:hypothetical protein